MPRKKIDRPNRLHRPPFMPTPQQIAAACEEIQARWTEQERQWRKHRDPSGLNQTKPRPMEFQVVAFSDFGLDEP